MVELSNSDGKLNHVRALDPITANSDCACAFKDEKEKGGGRGRNGRNGRIRHCQVCTERASITSQRETMWNARA